MQSDVSEPIPSSVTAPVQSDGNNYWFGGIGGGMNFSRDGLNYNSHGAGTAMDVYVGKWMNKLIGVRVGYQGLSTSNLSYGHADLLFKVGGWFVPYLHYGYLKDGLGGGIGLMLPLHLTKHIAIVPDVKLLAHPRNLFADGSGGLASTLSATLGISINLASSK